MFKFLLICFNSCNHIDHWLTLMFWRYRPKISDVVRGPGEPHSGTAHHVYHVSVAVNSIGRLEGGITAPWNIWLYHHRHYCKELLEKMPAPNTCIHKTSIYHNAQLIIIEPLTLLRNDASSLSCTQPVRYIHN